MSILLNVIYIQKMCVCECRSFCVTINLISTKPTPLIHSYSLTLIDSLDTLAVLGDHKEFRRVAKLLTNRMNFDRDINVSVFETNIRGLQMHFL